MTAENCGLPTPVCIRVVHIAPGPTPTLIMSAPALTRSRTPSAVTTLPATNGTLGLALRMSFNTSIIFSWWPCAVSITNKSTPAAISPSTFAFTSPLTPTAAAILNFPAVSRAG